MKLGFIYVQKYPGLLYEWYSNKMNMYYLQMV